jgi:hypothetical protein
MSHAISGEQIENLALGKLPTPESIRVQYHIYNCPYCLYKLIKIAFMNELQGLGPKPLCVPQTRKPLSFVHHTADGFIYSSRTLWSEMDCPSLGRSTRRDARMCHRQGSE